MIEKKFIKFIKINENKYDEDVSIAFDDYLYDIKTLEDLKDDNMLDRIHEIADGLVDYSNYDLLKWLSDDLNNVEYIHNSVDEFGLDVKTFNFWQLIKMGQYYYYYDLAHELYNDFIEYLEELEEEEEEEEEE